MTANSLLAVCFEPSLRGIWAKFNWSLLERVVAVALWMTCTWCFVGLMIARYLFYFFQVKGLLEVPAASSGVSAMKILASVGVAVTGIAIISGIYLSNKRWALLSTGLMIISGIYIFLARGDMTDCWESCGKWKFSCSNNSWVFCYKIHVFLDCIDWQRINFFVRAGKILICVCVVTIFTSTESKPNIKQAYQVTMVIDRTSWGKTSQALFGICLCKSVCFFFFFFPPLEIISTLRETVNFYVPFGIQCCLTTIANFLNLFQSFRLNFHQVKCQLGLKWKLGFLGPGSPVSQLPTWSMLSLFPHPKIYLGAYLPNLHWMPSNS